MDHSYAMLAPHYDRLWAELVPTPEHVLELTRLCDGLTGHRSTYEVASQSVWGTPDYWWYVAITDQMEGGGGAHTYLGNGQRLDEKTTQEPIGRGPFDSFVAGCVDALHGMPAPTSVSQAAYNWENFNGWGYLAKPIEDPYLASWSNKYTKGKYIADHVYDAEAVSGQPGALTLLKVLGVQMGPHDPLPPQKLPSTPPTPAPSPVVQTTKEGHIMVDVTQIEKNVNVFLNIAETWLPYASALFPAAAPVVSIFLKVIAGVRTVESQMGIPTTAALAAVDDHITPGKPNSPALS